MRITLLRLGEKFYLVSQILYSPHDFSCIVGLGEKIQVLCGGGIKSWKADQVILGENPTLPQTHHLLI